MCACVSRGREYIYHIPYTIYHIPYHIPYTIYHIHIHISIIYACVCIHVCVYTDRYIHMRACVCVCVCVSQLSAVNEGADGRTSLYSSRDGSTPLSTSATGTLTKPNQTKLRRERTLLPLRPLSTPLAGTGTLCPFSLPSHRLSVYTLSLGWAGGGACALCLCLSHNAHTHTLALSLSLSLRTDCVCGDRRCEVAVW